MYLQRTQSGRLQQLLPAAAQDSQSFSPAARSNPGTRQQRLFPRCPSSGRKGAFGSPLSSPYSRQQQPEEEEEEAAGFYSDLMTTPGSFGGPSPGSPPGVQYRVPATPLTDSPPLEGTPIPCCGADNLSMAMATPETRGRQASCRCLPSS